MSYGIAKVRVGLQVRQQWFLESIYIRRGLRDRETAEKNEVNWETCHVSPRAIDIPRRFPLSKTQEAMFPAVPPRR